MSRKRTSIIWTTDLDRFVEIVKSSKTRKEIIIKLGMKFSNSHYKTINARIEEENIDISHFDPITDRKASLEKIPLSEILVTGSNYSRHSLKPRLVEEGLLEEKCESCGVGNIWNGKKLSLQLDHINGVNDDNRIENLRFLCPNYHSQTDTFGAKNQTRRRDKKESHCSECDCVIGNYTKTGMCYSCYRKTSRKVERPNKDVLLSQVSEFGYVGTAKKYGVSDNTIRKWLK